MACDEYSTTNKHPTSSMVLWAPTSLSVTGDGKLEVRNGTTASDVATTNAGGRCHVPVNACNDTDEVG